MQKIMQVRSLSWCSCRTSERRCETRHQFPLLSAMNRKVRLQWAHTHTHWTVEDWKKKEPVVWLDESGFLLRHTDGGVRIWRQQHESVEPTCFVSTVQTGDVVMVWRMFCWRTVGPLMPINHWLNATAHLSIVADHVHPFRATIYSSSNGYVQHHNVLWPLLSPDLNSVEHLLGCVKTGDWQWMTNLQKWCDAVMSAWTRSTKDFFQHFVESMS